jgi:RNA polymerase sigma-70 factor (ECF subfamily)
MAISENETMASAIHETRSLGDAELLACLPHLRAFAIFLTRNRDRADDLVQDTMVRALSAAHQFQAGTNLRTWLFTILRNQHYSALRKNRMQVQSLDDPTTREPSVPANQEASLEFSDFRRAFWQLSEDRREALILIGASGLSYDEAAKLCGCPRGTIKSRVSRARSDILRILLEGSFPDKRRDTPAMAGYIGHLLDGMHPGRSRAALPGLSA